MIRMKITIIVFIVLLLSACQAFHKPKLKPPLIINKWPESSQGVSFKKNHSNNSDAAANWWWAKYNDDTLNQLMALALIKNYDLQIAAANTDYVSAQLKSIEFAWIPNLSILTGYSSFPAMGNLGYFFGGMASYSLNVLRQIKAQKQAHYFVKANQYQEQAIQLAIIGQVAVSYFNLLAYREELMLYHQLDHDLDETLRLNNRLFISGVSSQKESYVAASDLAALKAKTEIIKHNIIQSQNALHYLTSQNPGPIAVKTSFRAINANLIVFGDLPMTTINNRPDIQEEASKLQAANEDIGVAQSELLPTISFANFYRTASRSLGGDFVLKDLNQLELAVPILNAQAFGDIAAKNAAYKQVYYQYLKSVFAALRDIDDDISENNQYSIQFQEQTIALKNLKKSCDIEKTRFDSGIGSYLQYITCMTQYNYSRLMLVQIKLGKMMSTVKLYQDLAIVKN
jgi:multidrug efflux system outer membrane protein